MRYQPVQTDDGLEIRNGEGDVVWGPSESYAWPPNEQMSEAVIADANIDEPIKSVLQLITGNVEIIDETTQS